MKLLLMSDGEVGERVASWLLENHRGDVGLVVTTADNATFQMATTHGIPALVFENEAQLTAHLDALSLTVDVGLLAWWPHIVRPQLLNVARCGFINTHPSYLPHNRGKHYNFWALVEQAPFGVSLHVVEAGIDCGDIVAQSAIHYSWEDTGETLFRKAQEAMVRLVKDSYPSIRSLQFSRSWQTPGTGSFHFAKELAPASVIDLDQHYSARDLLNRLRARTFPGYPACWFADDDNEYEVRVDIRRRQS